MARLTVRAAAVEVQILQNLGLERVAARIFRLTRGRLGHGGNRGSLCSRRGFAQRCQHSLHPFRRWLAEIDVAVLTGNDPVRAELFQAFVEILARLAVKFIRQIAERQHGVIQ
ncbi:hypothetical protein D3C71_1919930 [compost metagenome]